jgi:predicted secreted protein
MMQIDESANGTTVELGVGETLDLRLPENRTAGYRWQVEAGGEPVGSLVSDSYQAADGPPGRGGTRELRFRAERSGEGEIRLAYRRSWETESSAARTFLVRVRARG